MNEDYRRYSEELPILMKKLRKEPLLPAENLPTIPSKGIYVFYEGEKPIYVGRSNNMRRRIKEHCAAGSNHHSATFAFKMARKTAADKGVDLSKTQKSLAQDTGFANIFREERERILKMHVRVIEVTEQIIQYLFEAYAVLELGTREYNDFETH